MRILLLIPTLVVGGAERMVGRLAHHLRRWGHDVAVVAMFSPLDTWIEREIRAEGIPIHFLGKRAGLDLRMIPRIARVVGAFRPDVVHTNLAVLKYVLPALAVSKPRPIVHTVHNLAEREAERPSRILNRFAFRAGLAVPVAIGAGVAESIRSTYGFVPEHVILNGIPVSEYAPVPGARESIRASLGIPAEAPVLVSVAMFTPQKNHEGLIDAFASERLRKLGAYLLLAGDGERCAMLKERARDRGCADRIRFLGVRSDIPAVLAAADVFVLASHYEGNPLAVMEAMASGRPVVATAVGCVPELVVGGAGRLVPPANPAALESAVAELACDPRVAREMGAAAARVARERFDDEVMALAYQRLYRRVLGIDRADSPRDREVA